jgi:hypothetical protein
MHTFRHFKRSCIMLYSYAKPWEDPSAVATLSIFILLSARINSFTRCTVASVAVSRWSPSQSSSATFKRLGENILTQLWTALCNKHFPHRPSCELLYATNTSHSNEYILRRVRLLTITHNRMQLFSIILFKHGRHFDNWNQPLNVYTHSCYLHRHEPGLCCYIVIHIENLSHPSWLFFFHLCPIYWRSLVYTQLLYMW